MAASPEGERKEGLGNITWAIHLPITSTADDSLNVYYTLDPCDVPYYADYCTALLVAWQPFWDTFVSRDYFEANETHSRQTKTRKHKPTATTSMVRVIGAAEKLDVLAPCKSFCLLQAAAV